MVMILSIKLPVIPHHPRREIGQQELLMKSIRKHFQVPAGAVAVYLEKILNDLARFRTGVFRICFFIGEPRLLFTNIYCVMKINQEIVKLVFCRDLRQYPCVCLHIFSSVLCALWTR